MNGIRYISTAGLGAAIALAASRVSTPDGAALQRGLGSLGHDAHTGLRAMAWEAARTAHAVGLDLPVDAVAALGAQLHPLTGIIIVVCAAGIGVAATALLHRRPDTPGRREPGSQRAPDRRVVQARDLARKGGMALDVARQTALSRDAVSLLARVPGPDGVAGGGRSFRRTAAR